jgi:hypothetical protein
MKRLVRLDDLRGFPPLLVSHALLLLADEWTDADITRRLDPARVLAEAWHAGRLARCRERLAAGEQAPAIAVVGFRIGRLALYDVSDGLHRAVAHREAGRKVKARISGYHRIEPSRYVLAAGSPVATGRKRRPWNRGSRGPVRCHLAGARRA